MTRPRPLVRYIYVIGPLVGLQKVGLATDPQSRLATFQTASPFDLVLHAAFPVPFGDAHAIERRAHRLLVRSCVRNEWFETTPADAISAVKAAFGPVMVRAVVPAPSAWAPQSQWRIPKVDRVPVVQPERVPLVLNRPTDRLSDHVSGLPLFAFRAPTRRG